MYRKIKESQTRLKTVKIISDAFGKIMGYLQRGQGQPRFVQQFDTDMDRMIQKAWNEQDNIGWENMLKGSLSKKWGQAQAEYYELNPHTRDSKKYSGESWTRIIIKAFLDYTLES